MPYRSRFAVALVLAAAVHLAGATPLAAVTPVGEPFRLDDGGTCRESDADLARLADGGFVAVWVQGVEPDDDATAPLRVHARLFDADGSPRGPAFPADGQGAPRTAFTPVVAASGDGGFLIAWVTSTFATGPGFTAHARAFTSDGSPIGEPVALAEVRQPGDVHAAGLGSGYRLVWVQSEGNGGFFSTLTVDAATGQPSGETTPLGVDFIPELFPNFRMPQVAGDDQGYSIAWEQHVVGPPDVIAFRAPTLEPPYPLLRLDLSDPGLPPGGDLAPAIGTDADGDTVVVWRHETTVFRPRGLRARVFAADGTPRTPPRWLTGPDTWNFLSDPALALAADGTFQVAWSGRRLGATEGSLFVAAFDAGGRPLAERTLVGASAATGSALDLLRLGDGQLLLAWNERVPAPLPPGIPVCESSGILAQRLSLETQHDLLLHDGRFSVRVDWRDPYSAVERTGVGVADILNDESGWFWFFRPGNAELVVKVLDGRAVNGHWWVFWAGLSSLEYTLEVTDRSSGEEWSFTNPPFLVDSGADTMALPAGSEPAAATPGATTATPVLEASATTVASGLFSSPCTDLPAVGIPPEVVGLCLHGRFEVTVEWSFPDGEGAEQARGGAVAGDSGYLWFFRPDNAEVFVKILDARGVNGRWWLFAGSLTSLPYTLTVHDLFTGEQRTYESGPGAFASFVDTQSFADSPP